jgi:phenylpropionate dioxygenase-like ring-hydroxylating dioxygenase large terminal subunit
VSISLRATSSTFIALAKEVATFKSYKFFASKILSASPFPSVKLCVKLSGRYVAKIAAPAATSLWQATPPRIRKMRKIDSLPHYLTTSLPHYLTTSLPHYLITSLKKPFRNHPVIFAISNWLSMILNQWYIACFEEELDDNKPIRRKIVGKDVVVFKTESGKIIVLEDRCCHRNVRLSLGYVKGEQIKCGYHGWEYSQDGACTHIPSLREDQPIPKAAKVKSYPTVVKHKIVWAYFGDDAKIEQAEIPPFKELDQWPFIFNYHEVKGNIKLIAESLFDAQHINHVHRNSIKTMIGNLSNEPTDFNLQITDTSLLGSYIRYNERDLFEKIYFGFKRELETHFGFWFPHSSMLDLHFPKRRMVIYEHFYEMDEGKCMMIQITTWKNIFKFNPWFAKWFMSRKSNKIVEEDIDFLESNREWHSKKPLNDLLIKPDELTFAFTRIWDKNVKSDTAKSD